VAATAAGDYARTGKVRLGNVETDLTFRTGSAEGTACVPAAQL
jgi:hypothetical protein